MRSPVVTCPVVTCLLVALSVVASAQAPLDPALQMRVDVTYLSADLLGGRASGSRFGDAAAQYVAARFAQLGITGVGDSLEYLQSFPITVAGHGAMDNAPKLTGTNVLAYLDRGAAQTVLIGAHHDHLGFGGAGSLHTGDPEPHNGADDNASGVAVTLALAERFAQADTFRTYNLLFATFDAEEMGLVGSKYLAANLPGSIAPLAAMINFDMVGRLSNEAVLAVNGTGTSPLWDTLLAAVTPERITLRKHASGLGPSDHASFYLADLPVLHFFTGQHPQYHKPDDDVVLINFEGMRTITELVYDLVSALPAEGIAFAKTKDESQASAADFKVTMGVMPDYVYGGEGLRVDGVLEDRPAQKAGLERGDVIVKIDGVEVKDIYGYMEALGRYEVGQTVELIVEREGRKLRKRLTF